MDKNVLAAMARWPNVPDVFGWLSLSERGQWRLHPLGDALSTRQSVTDGTSAQAGLQQQDQAEPSRLNDAGESITSPQILQFINHNYAHDTQGQWFFQNGPQRVFVRLDAAPYILQTAGHVNETDSILALQTHNGLNVNTISAWYLDEAGRLYALTEHGPGLIAGRDLMTVLAALYTSEGQNLVELLEHNPARPDITITTMLCNNAAARTVDPAQPLNSPLRITTTKTQAPLKYCAASEIPGLMGFVRYPRKNMVTVLNQVE